MAVRMTERDLEALRTGIAEQVARETEARLWQEQLDRDRAKRRVERVTVISAHQLVVGDVICSTAGTRSFKAEMTVQRLDRESINGQPLRENTLWMEHDHGGSALYLDDPVLVEVPRPGTPGGPALRTVEADRALVDYHGGNPDATYP